VHGDILVSACQCATAIGLQEQVANRRKCLWLRALVVSVTEKLL